MKCPSPFGWRSTRSHWARGVSLDPRHREKRRGPGPDPSNRSRSGTCSDGNGGASPEAIGFQTHFGFERGAGAFARSRFLDRVSTSKQRVASFDAIRPRGDTKWEKRLGLTALASRHHVSRAFSPWSDGSRPGPQRGDTSPAVARASEGLVASRAAARGETAAFEPTVFDVWTAWS
jgi:hypothetical protein